MSATHEPIDAVITWVDGADPAHAARLAAFLGTSARPTAAHATRFSDAGEIEWCVASILRFAPWIRTIHVVTDRQVPPLVGPGRVGGEDREQAEHEHAEGQQQAHHRQQPTCDVARH